MKLFRLGVVGFDIVPFTEFPDSFQVVSCSSLIPLKRVELISEVLNYSRIPISWTHFGGESLAITTLKNSLPPPRIDLEIKWKGKVQNDEIQSFYASRHIDLLINLSASEGIPVSIMEAISFGIPVFANDVGGISEIVQPETGILIQDGMDAKEIAARLDQFLLSGNTRNEDFREGVKSFWAQNYSAERNHGQVVKHLLSQTFTLVERFG